MAERDGDAGVDLCPSKRMLTLSYGGRSRYPSWAAAGIAQAVLGLAGVVCLGWVPVRPAH